MKSLNNVAAETPTQAQWGVSRSTLSHCGLTGSPAADGLGGELKTMFGALTAGPIPDRMMQLMDALEDAFHRGELFDPEQRRIS